MLVPYLSENTPFKILPILTSIEESYESLFCPNARSYLANRAITFAHLQTSIIRFIPEEHQPLRRSCCWMVRQ